MGAAVVSLFSIGLLLLVAGASLSWRGRARAWARHRVISSSEASGVRSPRSRSSCS